MRKFIQILKYLGLYYVSCTLILFAFAKILGSQFRINNFEGFIPLKELGNRQLAWAFFGRSYNYGLFIGIIELIGGFLILFKRTRLAGLLLAISVYTNIALIDLEFEINDAIQHATIEFFILLIWLFPYLKDLKRYLWDMSGKFINNETNKNKIFSIYLPLGFIVLISAYSINRYASFIPNKMIGEYKITELLINSEKLELRHGEYTQTPMIFFEFRSNFVVSANDSSYYGNYEIKADSIFVTFNQAFRNIKSLKAKIDKDQKIIKGVTNNKQTFKISIEKIGKEKQIANN